MTATLELLNRAERGSPDPAQANRAWRGSPDSALRRTEGLPNPQETRSHSAAVSCEGVTKEYGTGDTTTVALRGVDLALHSGELSLVVGPSGCGKTTLISIIAGLLNSTRGSVTVLGTELSEL